MFKKETLFIHSLIYVKGVIMYFTINNWLGAKGYPIKG